MIRKDPVQSCGKVVRTVRIEAADEFGDDETFYQHLVAELGTDSAIEKQLLRVRAEVIGPTPRSRSHFHPEDFLDRIYGDRNDVIVCDSDKLDVDWRVNIDKVNANSEHDWSKLTDEMRNIEEEYHQVDDGDEFDISQNEINDEEKDVLNKDLPKRVLAYTTKKLLKELANNR